MDSKKRNNILTNNCKKSFINITIPVGGGKSYKFSNEIMKFIKNLTHIKMKYLCLMVIFCFVGCSTLPKGERELTKTIEKDKINQSEKLNLSPQMGRPTFIKAYAYPRMLPNGHFFKEGQIYVLTGREELNLQEIFK